jgi:hypothetical protein
LTWLAARFWIKTLNYEDNLKRQAKKSVELDFSSGKFLCDGNAETPGQVRPVYQASG